MKKLLVLLVIISLFTWTLNVYAGGSQGQVRGVVRDNNNGEEGNILIHSGKIQGRYNDVGTWTDIKTVPELKGDQGIQGEKGTVDKKVLRKINKKIRTNKKGIKNNTNFINYVNDVQTNWNNQQDVRLDNHNNRLNNHENRLNNHEGRIEDLEEMEVNVIGEVEFIRQKNYKVGVYGKYDVRHNRTPEVGLRVTIGLGKSYAQKEREQMQEKMDKLEKALEKILKRAGGKNIVVEKKETEAGTIFEIDQKGTTKILKRF